MGGRNPWVVEWVRCNWLLVQAGYKLPIFDRQVPGLRSVSSRKKKKKATAKDFERTRPSLIEQIAAQRARRNKNTRSSAPPPVNWPQSSPALQSRPMATGRHYHSSPPRPPAPSERSPDRHVNHIQHSVCKSGHKTGKRPWPDRTKTD